MGLWSVIVPERAQLENLVRNPSFEVDATYVTAIGGTATRVVGTAKRGAASIEVAPTSGVNDGVRYAPPAGDQLTTGHTFFFSVDFKGQAGIPYKLWFSNTSSTLLGSATQFTGTGNWQRIVVSYPSNSTISFYLNVTKDNSANTGHFFIDGLLMLDKSYDTIYFDGDNPEAYWEGAPGSSRSKTLLSARLIGQVKDLDLFGFYVSDTLSAGAPPVTNDILEYSELPGGSFEGFHTGVRKISFVGEFIGSSRSDFHAKRTALWNVIKPDATGTGQPVLFRYSSNNERPIFITGFYDSGFNSDVDELNGKASLTFSCPDPFFYEDGNDVAVITVGAFLAIQSVFGKHLQGIGWDDLSAPTITGNSNILCLAVYKNKLYVGGDFSFAGIGANYFAVFDVETRTWTHPTGNPSGVVHAISVDPDGNVYVCGDFSSVNGVTNTSGIAKWNGSVWSALGTGLTLGAFGAFDIASDKLGNTYVVGDFSSAGGVANTLRIAKWNGSAWSALGTGLSGGIGYGVAVDIQGNVIATGAFTGAGGVANTDYIAKWNGSTWMSYGSGSTNGSANLPRFDSDGNLYVAGSFTTIKGIAANYIAKWNGNAWYPLGSGLNASVKNMQFIDGKLYVVGNFTTAGGFPADRISIWDGSIWLPFDARIGTNINSVIKFSDMVIFSTDSQISFLRSDILDINNQGTAESEPKFYWKFVSGTVSFTIKYVKNEISGKTIYISDALLVGEDLSLDLTSSVPKVVSNIFGDVLNRVIARGSDLAAFKLLAGANKISVFSDKSGTPTTVAWMLWRNKFWSWDGI